MTRLLTHILIFYVKEKFISGVVVVFDFAVKNGLLDGVLDFPDKRARRDAARPASSSLPGQSSPSFSLDGRTL